MPATIQYRNIMGDIIEQELLDFWKELIYKPLTAAVNELAPKKIKLNAEKELPEQYLLKQIKNSNILYDGKYFYGKIDARVSKALKSYGAEWDSTKKAFRLSAGKLTPDLKTAVSISASRLKSINSKLDMTLTEVSNKIPQAMNDFNIDKGLDRVINDLQAQALKATAVMGVSFTLTADMKKKLRDDYTNNMRLYIQDWTDEHIKDLRDDVEANAMSGLRFDKLINMLEYRYGTTKSKAQFLARQETSLFMSKFRRERFMDSGLNYYRWSTSKDQRVRPDHKKLDGRIFIFGDPPIDDLATGKRHEPGESFGCRCIAIPIVSTKIRKINNEYVII